MTSHEQDDDILELGPDGAFDIPTVPVANNSKTFVGEVIVEEEEPAGNVLERVANGEFKVFQKSGQFSIVVRVAQDCYPTKCRMSDQMLIIDDSEGRMMKVDLPQKVNPKSLEAKYFGEYVVIKVLQQS